MSSATADCSSSEKIASKWEQLYALRDRVQIFAGELEKRYELFPPPFIRKMTGDPAKWDGVAVEYSEAVTMAAGGTECMLGVFNHHDPLPTNSRQFIAHYSGWIFTTDEYHELNSPERENMNALYG